MTSVRTMKMWLPVLSVVLLAPIIAVSLVTLLLDLYSVMVRPVSLSFRLFSDDSRTSFISLPRPLAAVGMLLGSIGLILAAFRSSR